MLRLRTILASAALAAMAAGGGYLYAQPADDDAPVATQDFTAPSKEVANLSPQQMRDKSDELIGKMQKLLQQTVQLQSTARKSKDVIKLNCVNDKLLQVKQLLNIAESARNNLIEAITLHKDSDRFHQYGQITISHEKVKGLHDEAEACIGEDIVFVGDTKVEVDGPDIVDDPTVEEPFPGWEIEDPTYASPYF